jgi:hypothetical protein
LRAAAGRSSTAIPIHGFEIQIDRLLDEHLPLMPKLAESAISLLAGYGDSPDSGKYTIHYRAHLRLEDGVTSRILGRHLEFKEPDDAFEPDAFAYKIRLANRPDNLERATLDREEKASW